MVIGVESGSPAEQAGVRQRDVIVGLDEKPMTGVDDLHRLLTEARIGVPSKLTVLRPDGRAEIEVVPTELVSERLRAAAAHCRKHQQGGDYSPPCWFATHARRCW